MYPKYIQTTKALTNNLLLLNTNANHQEREKEQ